MTWLLAKLGLSLADGKTLLPIAAVLAAAAALVALGLYAVHHFTSAGYESAVAECRQQASVAGAWKTYLEGELRAANEPVIVDHVRDQTTLAASRPAQMKEVEANVKANPVQPDCRLGADGLRLWNAAPSRFDAGLPLSPEPAGAQPGQPAPSDGPDTARPAAQPRGFQAGLPGALAETPGPLTRGAELFGRASEGFTSLTPRPTAGAH